jgi:hypothetical protein
MQKHPCTHLWVGQIKHKYPIIDPMFRVKFGAYFHTLDSERACRQAGPLTRCMDWHKKYHAKQKPCRSPATCGCRKDTPERQAWKAATNACTV